MKMRTFSVWPPPCARLRAGSGDCLPAKRIPPLLLRTNPGSSSALTWRKRGESPLLFLGSSPGGGRGCPGRKCGGATKARLTQKMIIILCQYHINFPPGRVGFGWVGRESGAGCWRLSSATDKDEYGQKKIVSPKAYLENKDFFPKHVWKKRSSLGYKKYYENCIKQPLQRDHLWFFSVFLLHLQNQQKMSKLGGWEQDIILPSFKWS